MKDFHIVVIGAGPGGSMAAFECASRGLGRVSLLEKARFPRVKPCAGCLSPRAKSILSEAGLWSRIEKEAYPITHARMVMPDGSEMLRSAGEIGAAVLERSRFDQILVDAAVERGVTFWDQTRVDELVYEEDRVVGVRVRGDTLRARIVLVANGATSRFHLDLRPKEFLLTCLAWYEGVPFRPNCIEMIFDPSLAPHYGWLFPESPTRVNIGIGVASGRIEGTTLGRLYQGFIDRNLRPRLKDAVKVGRERRYPISPCFKVQHHGYPGTLLVGESCRLVNAFSGEGISYALQSGRIAAQALQEGFTGNWSVQEISERYRSLLDQDMGTSLQMGEKLLQTGLS